MELLTIRWLKEMLGYPDGARGLLVSGGSMANFAGIAAARSAKAPDNVVRDGMRRRRRMRLYVSAEAPLLHPQGRRHARHRHRQRPRSPCRPTTACAWTSPISTAWCARIAPPATCPSAWWPAPAPPAPEPSTRSAPIADFARAHDLWLHVDGAYGGFAALAPSARALRSTRIGDADSVSLDPHKWLYLPVGCGCVLYRDPATARAAFSENADYTRVVGLEHDEAFAFWDYGPELSRPFRALDLWLLLKSVGATRARARPSRRTSPAPATSRTW